MSAQHTPGPWAIRAYGDLKSGSVHADGKLVASIYTTRNDAANRDANARLIAAAPEMLEALRLIARSEGFKDGTWVGELQGIARAAIAKAEGRCEYCGVTGTDPHRSGCHYEGDDLELP